MRSETELSQFSFRLASQFLSIFLPTLTTLCLLKVVIITNLEQKQKSA